MRLSAINGAEYVIESPNSRRDRLTALVGALQPAARPCAIDDPEATLVVFPARVVLRLSAGGVAEQGALLAVRYDFAVPLAQAMPGVPDRIEIALDDAPALAQLAAVLVEEAGARRCGSRETVARLSEAILVLALRRALDGALTTGGLLAGLSHPRLHRSIVAIQGRPDRNWTVEMLAEEAGMSRSRFMAAFREVTGLTPLSFLTRWCMGLARAELEAGRRAAEVARRVGYGSVAALRRAMRRNHAPSDPPEGLPEGLPEGFREGFS
jgi:AraC-like DNA-binding protein